jgi:uncharacterized protein
MSIPNSEKPTKSNNRKVKNSPDFDSFYGPHMKNTPTTASIANNRIDVVDALRGFAIMTIMLLHNMEHFDFMWTPGNLPAWRLSIDEQLWNFTDFFIAGKSYAIFALLFGFTFALMDRKQAEKGLDFRLRFLWRMFLLLLFGTVNSLFYEGDILTIYALLGFTLVLVARMSDRVVLVIAIFLLAQPLMWVNVVHQLLNPDFILPQSHSNFYFSQIESYLGGNSFFDAAWGNLTNGKAGVYWWSWEKGRFFQAPALFMLGMLLCRRQLFVEKMENFKFWKKMVLYSVVFVVFFMLIKSRMNELFPEKNLQKLLKSILYSWSNLAMMCLIVSSIALAFRQKWGKRLFSGLLSFGRMSLTNYVMQSMLGAIIYYGFGFGLYKYTDAIWCLFIGILLFLFQSAFCKWWLRHHRQGPLEALWHRGTYLCVK